MYEAQHEEHDGGVRFGMKKLAPPLQRYTPVTESGCWLWDGCDNGFGYGLVTVKGTTWVAHRYFYTQLRGPIPNGLTLDHLCRVRCCVNPNHLEPVTMRENCLRGISFAAVNAAKTHCDNGHSITDGHHYITPRKYGFQRTCKECRNDIQRRYRAKKRLNRVAE